MGRLIGTKRIILVIFRDTLVNIDLTKFSPLESGGRAAICSQPGLLDGQANELSDATSVFGIDLVEMLDHALLDVAAALAETASDVSDCLCTHFVVEDFAEELARLLVVVVGVLVRVATGLANHSLLFPGVDFVLNGLACV